MEKNSINIKGVTTHNLKNISLNIVKNKLIVISGVSGSGKSSLAFDTLFAEGQRRYIESLSSYARQFLGKIKKPAVERIEGICPAIAIEQKRHSNNPRSTIGTNTEIYDYLKLLFSRIGKIISPISNKEIKIKEVIDVVKFIEEKRENVLILIKYQESIFDNKNHLIKKGFSRILVENKILKIKEFTQEENENIKGFIYIIIDRIIIKEYNKTHISDSIELAFTEGKGECIIKTNDKLTSFSKKLEEDGILFEKPDVNLFAFNNPHGACQKCQGFGTILGIDKEKVITAPNLSVYEGVINCWSGKKLGKWKDRFIKNISEFNFPIHRPYKNLNEEEKNILWNGKGKCKGINQFFKYLEKDKYKIQNRVLIARYRGKTKCTECYGTRLRKEALYIKVKNKNIAEITEMTIKDALDFFQETNFNNQEISICERVIKEITNRLYYLNEMGLDYLTLNRKSNTLSGGESQRINLAKSISSSLVGSMYILDEPSIGLHAKDTQKLIKILKELRDIGNTVIVVEHDEEIMLQSDQIIDIGPKAGRFGGNIVFQGIPKAIYTQKESLTTKYLSKELTIPTPKKRRKLKEKIKISNITKHNLKNLNIEVPIGGFVLITGVSGSGKSTLVNEIIKPAVENRINNQLVINAPYKEISITSDKIKKVELINQNPIGRSSRSNPVTYTKVYDDIRRLFSEQPLSKQRKYKTGFFSFNIDGGRCDYCKGEGEIKIEMQFMADVYVKCEDCHGKRFKNEVLDVKFFNKNIFEILNLSIEEGIDFFRKNKAENIANKLQPLIDVGLGYVTLGQSSNTLSGGEAQRIKLASFLSKSIDNKKTLFIFDEPTTGLHFHDINKLIKSFNHLIEKGHSIICIEHNLDVIKCADWIIDLGPEGGYNGGEIIFEGIPERIINCKKSITGEFLKNKL